MGHVFPYREEGNPPILRPTLDVRIQHDVNGDWSCRALVDTGSPITFFDRGVADALNVRLHQAGARQDTIRILGGTWRIQFEHVAMELPEAPEISWETQVGFVVSPELQMPFQGVLGTVGFLDNHAVTFNRYYDYFIVDRPDDCHTLHDMG